MPKEVLNNLPHQCPDIFFDALVIAGDFAWADFSRRRNRLISFFFPVDGGMVIPYLTVKGFEVDLVGRVVGDHTDELTGGKAGDFGSGYGIIQLGGTADGGIAAIDRYAFLLLVDLAKALGQLLSGIAGHLPANHITDDIHDDFSLLPSIVLFKLTIILHRQRHGYFVGARRRDQVINAINTKIL